VRYRMAGFNQVTLLGNLTRDPELRYTASGTAVANGRIASNEKRKDNDEVLFLDFVVWNKPAEVFCQYMNKGNQVLLVGRLREVSWEQDGQPRKKLELTVENFRFVGRAADSNTGEIEPF